ncbi:galactokinase [Nitriliruptor alkaliphilus]|uniref:galactokinase n=1 Tax=Nitriliruptor alkaliphilus TaxID=427918 RepID=UPI000695D1C2|nr:galactokinase family protein [Nitriliruptor alkaliphilus]
MRTGSLPPGSVVRAPGRANLIGEHTDHTDGLVLPVAIDRTVRLTVEVSGGDRIRLTSAQAPGVVDVAADGSEVPADGWGRYVAAVAAELTGLGRDPVGLTGALDSDLPQGCGLSSSAALEVVVGTALCLAAGFGLEPLQLAAACRRAEHRAVGVPSGIMDQAASILGRRGQAVLLDCGTLEHRTVPLPADHALLLIDSGVRRQLETSGYAERSRELAAALPVLGGRRPLEVDPAELDDLLADVDAVPARRLRHVVTENARVGRVVAALEAGDLVTVGRCFAEGHASLRDDYEVSIPELDGLVDLAGEAGATAARMTGGGFGGAIVALVPVDRADDVAAEVVDGARARWPQREVVAHRCSAVDGAGLLT